MNAFYTKDMTRLRLIYIGLLVLGFCLPNVVSAQNSEKQLAPKTAKVRPDKPPYRIKTKFGVMGHFHGGVTWGFFNNLQKDLENPEFFTENWVLNNLGTNYGGNIMFQIGNYLMVGGGGNGFSYDASLASFATDKKGEVGEARQRGYYFTPMLGVVVINRAFYEYDYPTNQYNFRYRWMLYPFLGLGVGGENTLKLSNYSQDRKYFGGMATEGSVAIPRSEFREFTTNLTMLELGIGTKFMKNNKGGITIGAELGGYFNLGSGKWTDKLTGAEVKGVNDATMSGLYLRVTVGGSFFKNKEIVGGKSGSSSSSSEDGYVKPEEVEKPKKEKKKKSEEPENNNSEGGGN